MMASVDPLVPRSGTGTGTGGALSVATRRSPRSFFSSESPFSVCGGWIAPFPRSPGRPEPPLPSTTLAKRDNDTPAPLDTEPRPKFRRRGRVAFNRLLLCGMVTPFGVSAAVLRVRTGSSLFSVAKAEVQRSRRAAGGGGGGDCCPRSTSVPSDRTETSGIYGRGDPLRRRRSSRRGIRDGRMGLRTAGSTFLLALFFFLPRFLFFCLLDPCGFSVTYFSPEMGFACRSNGLGPWQTANVPETPRHQAYRHAKSPDGEAAWL